MSQTSRIEPRLPFMVINHHYACRFTGGKIWSECIHEHAFNKGTFSKDAFIIDADCRKFPVIGAEKLGWCTHRHHVFGLMNLFSKPERRMYKFRFLVGEPIQMTFGDVKQQVLDHMVARGFYRGSGGGSELYRNKRKDLPTIEEFFNKVVSGGIWPF
jgi:hypothetical protein